MIRRAIVPDVADPNIERARNMTERLAPVVERLEILPVREREFIERYYINGETYREIAETAGVCHQRVRQIIVHGLARLRKEVKYDRL